MNRLFTGIFLIILSVSSANACGMGYNLRSYLDSRFWQPLAKYENMLGNDYNENRNESNHPYSGSEIDDNSPPIVNEMRSAYQSGEYVVCTELFQKALTMNISEKDRNEIRLIKLKAEMWESKKDNAALLDKTVEEFKAYSKEIDDPSLKSEATGWLAHIHYIRGEYSSAAKIYLSELNNSESVFSRNNLITSLMLLFPYNGSSKRLYDHIEEYFDTPSNALFVINLVTNPVYSDDRERKRMAEVAQKAISVMHKHRELFTKGNNSDALTLAMMRTAMYMGDTDSALKYASDLQANSKLPEIPEYNWMIASCFFIKNNYAGAEKPLVRMYNSKKSSIEEKITAAHALIGVYFKTGRHVEQLHIAFLHDEKLNALEKNEDDFQVSFKWPFGGWLFDLPYMLDVQFSDKELEEYLAKYGKKRIEPKYNYSRQRSATEMVEYALAVRHARKQEFEKAAAIYERLNATPRATRMKKLVRLYADASNTLMEKNRNLEARFAYADFLEANSCGIFFNDMLWHGYQTWIFVSGETEGVNLGDGLTKTERESFLAKERKLRDDQEERWMAYKIFSDIAEKTDHSDLRIKAAKKGLLCLGKISMERFGRKEEIEQGRAKIMKMLVKK